MGLKSTLKTLPIDLMRLSESEQDRVFAKADLAARAGVEAFDAAAERLTTTHPPMRSRVVKTPKKGFRITLSVSPARARLRHVQVSPSLDSETTGYNRRAVTVTGWRRRPQTLRTGFIHGGKILVREGSRVVSADSMLSASLPAPGEIIAQSEAEIYAAVRRTLES